MRTAVNDPPQTQPVSMPSRSGRLTRPSVDQWPKAIGLPNAPECEFFSRRACVVFESPAQAELACQALLARGHDIRAAEDDSTAVLRVSSADDRSGAGESQGQMSGLGRWLSASSASLADRFRAGR
jgi:hypothetical protein